MNKKIKLQCTIIPIIGRYNVGKSTLFNKLINKKLSITSKKKNTTLHNIIGVKYKNNKQFIYIDTSGLKDSDNNFIYIKNIINYIKKKFNINKNNLFILITENKINIKEINLIKTINKFKIPILLLINKIDKLINKSLILKTIQNIKHLNFVKIIPTNLKQKKYINLINKIIKKFLFNSNHFNFINKITNKKNKYIVSEIIREKTIRLTGDEIPYNLQFKIEKIINEKNILYIWSIIFTNKKRYIKMLIGKNGKKIKKIIYLSIKSIKKYLNINKKIQLYINFKIQS